MKQLRAVGRNGLALALLSGLVAGCVSYGGLTQDTMAACIGEAGITGSYSASSSLRNDRMTFIVRPGPNVTEAQAEVANACIARVIDGGQPGKPAVQAAPRSTRPVSGGSCAAGGGLMQGGTGYCTR